MSVPSAIHPEPAFLAAVESHSGQKVSACYQCRKCTNGCPLAFAMDLMPNQVMRMIQFGLEDELLRSKTIWICASCQTCTTRCPNDIDIAHVMDALRQLSRESGVPPGQEKVVKFHEAVLGSIYRHGRLFELGMVLRYKLAARDPLADAKLGWQMFTKGKLKFWPAKIAAKDQVRAMFRKQRKG
jgi:heterodisulfide reductase subunit C